jgi:hypothetical protein
MSKRHTFLMPSKHRLHVVLVGDILGLLRRIEARAQASKPNARASFQSNHAKQGLGAVVLK